LTSRTGAFEHISLDGRPFRTPSARVRPPLTSLCFCSSRNRQERLAAPNYLGTTAPDRRDHHRRALDADAAKGEPNPPERALLRPDLSDERLPQPPTRAEPLTRLCTGRLRPMAPLRGQHPLWRLWRQRCVVGCLCCGGRVAVACPRPGWCAIDPLHAVAAVCVRSRGCVVDAKREGHRGPSRPRRAFRADA